MSHNEALEWDIEQNLSMTREERQKASKSPEKYSSGYEKKLENCLTFSTNCS